MIRRRQIRDKGVGFLKELGGFVPLAALLALIAVLRVLFPGIPDDRFYLLAAALLVGAGFLLITLSGWSVDRVKGRNRDDHATPIRDRIDEWIDSGEASIVTMGYVEIAKHVELHSGEEALLS
jgi:hypothetical protein